MQNNKDMNELAVFIDDFLYHGRYNKTEIANKLNISKQGFHALLRKKNFSIDDANRILDAIGYKIDYSIKPKD